MKTVHPEIRPTLKQEAAWDKLLDLVTRFILFGGGAGGGKTWLYCEWLLTQCYQHPGSRWFIGRNELKRLMSSTFITWGKVCAHHKIPKSDWKLDGKYNVIRFKNGSTIDLLDVKYMPTDPDYERLGSTEYNGGFGEEIGEWHFKAFDVLKSRIGRHKLFKDSADVTPFPKFGLSCNPTKSWPYRVFYRPWKEGTLPPEYAFIQALYLDNPHTAAEYGRQLDEISDNAMRQRLRDGNWEYEEGAGTLMRYDNIRDMFTNAIVKDGEKYLIVDVARYGRDKTVFNFFEGLESTRREAYSEQGTDKTIQLIRDAAAAERIPYSHILIDEDGVGGGVVDQLPGVKGFVAASSPVPTRTALRRQMLPSANLTIEGKRQVAPFQHLKAQCAFKLAELVETHRIACKPGGDQDEITEEFAQIRQRDVEKDGKLKIVPKEEVREALGRSPDVGDTFIMRMYFELLKDAAGSPNRPYEGSVRDIQRRAVPRRMGARGV
jgi:hypothetical protein